VESDPPINWDEGFDRLARSLGSIEKPSDVRRLAGGMEAQTASFRLGNDHYVVKVCAKSGDEAEAEFDNLAVISVATVPTPDPVVFDAGGSWFGYPAVVMTALPGRPDMHPADPRMWIVDAAEGLTSIHAVPSARATDALPPRWRRWKPSSEGMGNEAAEVEILLARFYEHAESLPTVLSHDDYNPGNLLYHDGRLSGVVDWADITIEPREASVALYRHFLAIHPGGDAPEIFLYGYERAASASLDNIPLWDVFYGLRGVRPVDHWVTACERFGLAITSAEIQERSRQWVRRAVERARR
jgi:aminoglycoside phosphotransferase (APT) family kinase protein